MSLSSLMRHPLLSSGTPHTGEASLVSCLNNNVPAISFEQPFDDHRLEPLPLREPPKVCLSSQSISMTDGFIGLYNEGENKQENIQVNVEPEDLGRIKGTGTCWPLSENDFSGLVDGNSDAVARSSLATEESTSRFRPFQDEKWKTSFQRLLQFKREFGHCCVPHSYEEDPALARWVKRQRHQYKKFKDNDPTSTLSLSRLEKLEAVGFVWHSHAAAWMEKLNDLRLFKAKTGHCNVPSTYPENVALSTWVKSQRRQYKLYVSGSPSTMTTLRFQVLKSLGFVFEPRLTTSKNAAIELLRCDELSVPVSTQWNRCNL